MSTTDLQKEFKSLLSEDFELFEWLTQDSLDGIWYCDLFQIGNLWINDVFWKSIGHSAPPSGHVFDKWSMCINTFDKNKALDLMHAAREEPRKGFKGDFMYTDDKGYSIVLHSVGKVIFDSGKRASRLVVKHYKRRNVKQQKLLVELEKLKKLRVILNETNRVAKVGGWEVDVTVQKISWTKVTKEIHEVPQSFEPDIESAINFYEQGWSRDAISNLFAEAIEYGKPFDVELRIITAKNNCRWVRVIGRPVQENGKSIRVYGAFQDITERKEREIEYRNIRERFEIIFNSSPVGILLINSNDNLLLINPSGIKIFGLENLSKDQLLKVTRNSHIHPEDLPKAEEQRKLLLQGKISEYTLESRFFRPNGEIIWCRTFTAIAYPENSEDYLITVQIEDITEAKLLEEQSLENAQRFRSAFEYSPNGMALVGLDGSWLMVNNVLSGMLGYKRREFLKLRFQEMTHQDDLDLDLRLLSEVIRGKRSGYSIEKRYIHKSGEIVYGLLNVSLIRDKNNTPQYFISQISDITSRVLAGKELERSLNDLRTLLNATTQVSIIETDLNGIIYKFNKGAENLLRYSSDEVVGKMDIKALHDKKEIIRRAKELSDEYQEAVAIDDVFIYKAKRGKHDSHEWTYIRKDGTLFPVQLVITAVRDENEEISGYVAIGTDISELKEMEKSLLSEKIRAEAANRSKSEFLANMSHEIRTPLNGVIGFTDLLMTTELNETQGTYMQMVNTSAHSLLDLINDILDFSKIEAGKLELYLEETDLIELCSQTIDIIKHAAHSKNLELLLDVSPNISRFVYADAVRLRQILINLLNNAIKFTEKGEVELRVRNEAIGNNENEMLFEFSIRDTGIGIAPHNLQKIFNAFDQEDASTTRKYGGTGLGITISNRLLELMDSRLEVKSEPNSGSVFSFRVRFKTLTGKSTIEEKAANISNVLIVDDNVNNRTILRDMLAFGEIASVSAENGIEALEVLESRNDFDLAIIDYNMPYLNGLDLIRHIREKFDIDKEMLPVILLHSSIIDSLTLDLYKQLDIKFEVAKPINIDRLFELISRITKKNGSNGQEMTGTFVKDEGSVFNIMVAEDNPVNQFLAKSIIQKILPKAIVLVAEDGEKAVKMYQKNAPDLIFMDIQMPVMSGFDASRQIRKFEKAGTRIPIIALTARTLKGERERCLEAGMDDYITKPILFDTIKAIAEKYLLKD
ncbi:PAS domain S-box protein [Flavobacterium alkalisoli]|uniref:Sensory/regulatory protein RpfC n=1 Tax=Flavobacterium alkalisoli TaxID=2602769 RepID=A0A5B9FSG9_9FLAO|nr:PAS domain S-box protein [Flavobacterium alkalisoli]QEE49864.1 PAS domain S-box protein [Flavobacterium alkalisoli]